MSEDTYDVRHGIYLFVLYIHIHHIFIVQMCACHVFIKGYLTWLDLTFSSTFIVILMNNWSVFLLCLTSSLGSTPCLSLMSSLFRVRRLSLQLCPQTLSPLSSSITPSLFHSRLITYLFHKSFPPFTLCLLDWLNGLLAVHHFFWAYPFLVRCGRLSWFPRALISR